MHETLRSANDHGAFCVNYVKATGILLDEKSQAKEIQCEDQVSGHQFQIKARHFVSSVGPWTDQLGEKFFKKWKRILRPTKGVHLTFKKDRLPLESAVVMATEKRIYDRTKEFQKSPRTPRELTDFQEQTAREALEAMRAVPPPATKP